MTFFKLFFCRELKINISLIDVEYDPFDYIPRKDEGFSRV